MTGNQDVTDKLSVLMTDLDFINDFYFLIDNVVSTSAVLYQYSNWTSLSSDLITKDLIQLIQNCLYIHQLASLSLSIPTESYSFDLSNFGVYIARVSNKTINITVGNSQVMISNDDTAQGRTNFEDTSNALDAVDVLLVSMDSDKNAPKTYIDTSGTEINANVGYICSDEVIVTIISGDNNTARHNLTNDATIIFENVDLNLNGVEANQLCVWYGESSDMWYTNGCTTSVNRETNCVTCTCSHLTKFAVISTLDGDHNNGGDSGSNLSDALGIGPARVALCSLFTVCFMAIVILVIQKIYILYKMQLLHKYKDKKESFNAIFVTGFCALLEAIGCGLLAAYTDNKNLQTNSGYVEFLTMILGLPLLLYFIMFTQALQGWMTVSNSLTSSAKEETRQKIFFILINTIVSFVFVILIMLLMFDVDSVYKSLFLYCEIIWLLIMATACIVFTFYSFKLRKVLYDTLKIVLKNQDKKSLVEQKKIIKRLTKVSIMLTVFFILQTLIGVYGVYVQISHTNYDVSLAMVDVLLNLLYLLAYLYLYIPNLNRLIHTEQRS